MKYKIIRVARELFVSQIVITSSHAVLIVWKVLKKMRNTTYRTNCWSAKSKHATKTLEYFIFHLKSSVV